MNRRKRSLLKREMRREYERCRKDFGYWARKYFRVSAQPYTFGFDGFMSGVVPVRTISIAEAMRIYPLAPQN